jgi:hypothetical protein
MKEVNFISAQDLTGRSLEMQKRPTAEEAKKDQCRCKGGVCEDAGVSTREHGFPESRQRLVGCGKVS